MTRQLGLRQIFDLASTQATLLPVHEGMVDLLVRGGASREAIRVLRNPVTPWTSERVAAEANRKILFVGRLDPDKGVDLLAEAARRAGIPLQAVGAGELDATLRNRYPEVELMGWQPRSEIARLCAEARLVCIPTRSRETFSLVAFEALASGLPVLITRFAATADEIIANDLGDACDPNEVDAMAELLRACAADDARTAARSHRAFSLRATLAPDLSAWGDTLEQTYQSGPRDERQPVGQVAFHGA